MGRKRLGLTLFANASSKVLSAAIVFFVTPYLVARLGSEMYGFYPLANSFVGVFGVISIALNSLASRFVMLAVATHELDAANSYFNSVVLGNLVLCGVLSIPMALIAFNIGSLLSVPEGSISDVRLLFALVFIGFLLTILGAGARASTFVSNRLEFSALIDAVSSIARVAVFVVLFSYLPPSVAWIGFGIAAAALLSSALHWALVPRLLPFVRVSAAFASWARARTLLISGSWNSVGQLGTILSASGAIVVCNVAFGPLSSGEYGIALSLPALVNGVIWALTSTFLPGFVHVYARRGAVSLAEEVVRAQRVMGIVTNLPFAVFAPFGGVFMALWIPEGDAERLWALAVLCAGHLWVTGVTWPAANVPSVLNRVRAPAIYLVGNGLVCLALAAGVGYWTDWGNLGVAGVVLVMNLVWVGGFVPLYSSGILGVSWRMFYPAVIRSAVSTGATVGFGWIWRGCFAAGDWFSLVMGAAATLFFGLLVNCLLFLGPAGIRERLWVKEVQGE